MAKGNNQRQEPTFSGDTERLGDLAKRLNADYPPPPPSQTDYAPPAIRQGLNADYRQVAVVQDTHSFLELPMKELEEIRSAARERMNELEQEANDLQQMFQGRIAAIKAKYERLRKGIDYSMDAFKVLREQCVALEEPSKEDSQ